MYVFSTFLYHYLLCNKQLLRLLSFYRYSLGPTRFPHVWQKFVTEPSVHELRGVLNPVSGSETLGNDRKISEPRASPNLKAHETVIPDGTSGNLQISSGSERSVTQVL